MDRKQFVLAALIILIAAPLAMAAYNVYRHSSFTIGDGKDIDLFQNLIGNGSAKDITCVSNCTGFNATSTTYTNITYLPVGSNATNLTGQLNNTVWLPVISGANLTSLNASNITNGTLADARLSTNVPLLNANNVFTKDNNQRLTGWNVSYEVLNHAATQNWYFGINDSDSSRLYVGAGYGAAQNIIPAIVVNANRQVLIGSQLGAGSANTQESQLDVNSSNSDNVATFTRQSASEGLIRVRHYQTQTYPAGMADPIIAMFGYRGTVTSPVATNINDNIAVWDGRGYDGATETDTSAQMQFHATQNWTSTAHGSAIDFFTTPNTNIAPQKVLEFNDTGRPFLYNLTGSGNYLCIRASGEVYRGSSCP